MATEGQQVGTPVAHVPHDTDVQEMEFGLHGHSSGLDCQDTP
jgi:hypothetical protein